MDILTVIHAKAGTHANQSVTRWVPACSGGGDSGTAPPSYMGFPRPAISPITFNAAGKSLFLF